ncbi:MAG: hypothetical protein BACD_02597 [Bacteroides rodentium]
MMEKNKVFILLVASIFYSGLSYGYEVATHAALTREAYQRSSLETTNLTQKLGIASFQEGLGNIYFDIDPDGKTVARLNNPLGWGSAAGYTISRFNEANAHLRESGLPEPTFTSIPGWLMVGAIREDDLTFNISEEENPPQDDPQGSFDRVLNHFYDPFLGGQGLSGFYVYGGRAAPSWAIDGKGLPGKENNHFSIRSAREAMFRAATLRTVESGQLKELPFPNAAIGANELGRYNDEDMRKAYWATVFRALGDVVHNLQDMGQPQHTRSDKHSGMGCKDGTDICIAGHASFYEKYLDAKVKNASTFELPRRFFQTDMPDIAVSPVIDSSAPSYGSYLIPRFDNFMSYFTGGTNWLSYRATGLANYSNMGFYTAGTNLGGVLSSHERPPRDEGLLGKEELTGNQIVNMANKPIENLDTNTKLTLLTYPVTDNLQGTSEPNVRLSTYSVFDQFLETKEDAKPAYVLNHYNYNAQADLLLPRAVGYSAGLIDYFFRGQMEISPPAEGVYAVVDHGRFSQMASNDLVNGFHGFDKIKLKLKNTTEDIEATDGGTYPQTMSDGFVVAVVKFYRNKLYTVDLDNELLFDDPDSKYNTQRSEYQEIVVSKPISLSSLAYDQDIELTFDFSDQEIPISIWYPVKLSVVFRGKLGDEEDAVVVTEKSITSPIYFTFMNAQDYIIVNDGTCYTPKQLEANEQLWSLLASKCKDESDEEKPKVAESCKNQPMEAAIALKSETNQITFSWTGEEGALPMPRFGRIAFLIDDNEIGTAYGKTTPSDPRTRTIRYNPETVNRLRNKPETFLYPVNRGLNFHIDEGYVQNGETINNTSGCVAYFSEEHPTKLEGDDRLPVPATSVSGW